MALRTGEGMTVPSLPPTLGVMMLDRCEGSAATSAGRGWPCGSREEPAVPFLSTVGSVPLLARGGDDADNVDNGGPLYEAPLDGDSARARRVGPLGGVAEEQV